MNKQIRLISKSILNRYEETCESDICTVYAKTAIPVIEGCNYAVIKSDNITGANAISDKVVLKSWFSDEEELDYYQTNINVDADQIVYVDVDCAEFAPFTSGDITYHWFFGLADEELKELSPADVGGDGFLVPTDWDVNAANIAIRWSWQGTTGDAAAIIKCVIRNEITETEFQEVATKSLIITK